jgi:hypothetical protein
MNARSGGAVPALVALVTGEVTVVPGLPLSYQIIFNQPADRRFA